MVKKKRTKNIKEKKNWWSRLNYWQKSALIGLALGLFFTTLKLGIYDSSIISIILISLSFFIPHLFQKGICRDIFICETSKEFAFFSLVITTVFICLIVGIVLSLLNKKYNLEKMKKRKLFAIIGFIAAVPYLIILAIDYAKVRGIILQKWGHGYNTLVVVGIALIASLTGLVLGSIYDLMKKKNWLRTVGLWSYIIIFILIIYFSAQIIAYLTLIWTGAFFG